MSEYTVFFFHLVGVLSLFSGISIALILRYAVIWHNSPRVAIVLLRLVRTIALPLVIFGIILAVCCGFATAAFQSRSLTDKWLIVSYSFVIYLLVIGGVMGREDRQTREMVEKVANCNHNESSLEVLDQPCEDLILRSTSILNIFLNGSMFCAVIVIVAMMVYKPGDTLVAN